MVSEIEYDEWVEELEAEVARLREALRLIYIRADVQADEPIYELAEAALSTPADEQGAEHWLSCHDEEVGREAIEQFVERVNRAAEFAMEKTGKLEGAHYAGMQLELAAIREGQDEISGVVGNRNENVADA